MSTPAIIGDLTACLGADEVRRGGDIEPRYLQDWAARLEDGAPLALVRPRSTGQVADVLRACHARGVAVTPQGGRTGMAGGATPGDGCVILSTERMSGVEEIDREAATLTALAGTPLQVIQEAAEAAGFSFPLDLGSRGSCTIGGNVATNAGGNRVIRYGMTRALVLGLEVVLADGTIISSLNKMLKNNAGYDLKQLFIGAEGTLGVITRVVVKLAPKPLSACTALCAVRDYASVVTLLRHMEAGLGGSLSAFEMMWRDYYAMMTGPFPGLPPVTPPLAQGQAAYVLVEAMGADAEADQARFEAVLEAAMAGGVISDAMVASSESQVQAMWRIREGAEFLQRFSPFVGFDISIPIGRIGEFIETCAREAEARFGAGACVSVGHVGDSNIHVAFRVAEKSPEGRAAEALIYGLVRDAGGSISAEHGVGLVKRAFLGHSRTPAEIALMRTLKAALDPGGILNPGKILGG